MSKQQATGRRDLIVLTQSGKGTLNFRTARIVRDTPQYYFIEANDSSGAFGFNRRLNKHSEAHRRYIAFTQEEAIARFIEFCEERMKYFIRQLSENAESLVHFESLLDLGKEMRSLLQIKSTEEE